MNFVLGTHKDPTFLGSGTAPDGITVQLRIRETAQKSRRRKDLMHRGGVVPLVIVTTALAQHLFVQSGSSAL